MGNDLTTTRRRAVFLDRDGVINEAIVHDGKPYPPANVRETIVAAHAPESLARLKASGFMLIVVTNQPDVRRGSTTQAEVEEIHKFLSSKLPLDDFFACYHDDRDGCHCRKPRPGLLLEAARRHNIEVAESYLIGDRWRDIDAGAAAGCRTIFIDHRYNDLASTSTPHSRVSSLSEAVDWILKQETKRA